MVDFFFPGGSLSGWLEKSEFYFGVKVLCVVLLLNCMIGIVIFYFRIFRIFFLCVFFWKFILDLFLG